ncbi:NUDIX hydrolase [Microbacterium gorillae]|uniref:NUDIX hydrolase n=1 Tax=Microbacterium gorillae TaxID=1231063 RepID=UPI00058FB4DB|nr:NUDIX domain-containing protein [Microbacterium gorillae]
MHGQDDDELTRAATVVLVRDDAAGPEVLVMLRPDRGSFAGAWVFPGGKVEPQDEIDAATEEDVLRATAVRETAEETGLQLSAADLTRWAVYTPPAGMKPGIRTWFFIAEDPGGELRLQASEVVRAEWLRPADMLALHASGEVHLYPPTFVTLHRLAELADCGAALVDHERGDFLVQTSQLVRLEKGMRLSWDGDDGSDAVPADRRHRVETSALPWRYERGAAIR